MPNTLTQKTIGRPAADRLAWWREARFGMFIHWGLYAIPAGVWKGKRIDGIGEQIQRFAKIPVREYEPLARQFNPTKFDARAWVDLARQSGAKYLVITAKHHDGFAMYGSKADPFNIVDSTPFGRDILKKLASECQRAGIRLCFYYSHRQDWHHPDGGWNEWPGQYDGVRTEAPGGGSIPMCHGHPSHAFGTSTARSRAGSPWHVRSAHHQTPNFDRYMRDKALPQVRELLTRYGRVGLIWYDTPTDITAGQSKAFDDLVHQLQPNCLTCNRVGNGLGDYQVLGDNAIPVGRVRGDWETPATINHTWGYKTHDHDWKSSRELLLHLIDLASKGVNYLLNVGPDARGIIPAPSARRLRDIGRWLTINGEAIYGTQASPFPYVFPWGRMTQRGNKLYLLITDWKRQLILHGLRSRVRSACILADRATRLSFRQTRDQSLDLDTLALSLPAKKPDRVCSVVMLHLSEPAGVDESPLQMPDGRLTLYAHMAQLLRARGDKQTTISDRGFTFDWFETKTSLTWRAKISRPGAFRAVATVGKWRYDPFANGNGIRFIAAGQRRSIVLNDASPVDSPRAKYDAEYLNDLGTIRISARGICEFTLEAAKIKRKTPHGLMIGSIDLIPVQPF